VLARGGQNLSNATAKSFRPLWSDSTGTTTAAVMVSGDLILTVADAGTGRKGTIRIYKRAATSQPIDRP